MESTEKKLWLHPTYVCLALRRKAKKARTIESQLVKEEPFGKPRPRKLSSKGRSKDALCPTPPTILPSP